MPNLQPWYLHSHRVYLKRFAFALLCFAITSQLQLAYAHNMPTTCGFPNCKFRSRYRGVEDNRHFYRIPKRPFVLRKRWLGAIGRTEETVVSQLRICSAHFEGGEKKEGDIPVADPAIDPPLSIDLPPKEGKTPKRAAKSSPLGPKSLLGRTSFTPPFLRQTKTGREWEVNHLLENSIHALPLLPDNSDISGIFGMASRANGVVSSRPLVALLDGRDCSVEMPILKDVATLAFCDAQSTSEIHEKVLTEAVAALMWHSIRLERADLEKFKALKVVVRIGSDADNIDLAAATDLGIAVCSTPSGCVEETADTTLSLILGMYRNTFMLSQKIAVDNKPMAIDTMRTQCAGTRRIRGETLGLVGFGRIGMAVALRAKAFGFHVLFYDPNVADGVEKSLGVERASSLIDLVTKSYCLSLHCPLTDDTRHSINETHLRAMPRGSFIVNTSRGGLINDVDLAIFLKNGHIRAAALDVFEFEPTGNEYQSNHLATLPNVIATAHSSWYSDAACKELREMAAKEVRHALVGRLPHDLPNCVNKEQLLQAPNRRPLHIGSMGGPGPSSLNPFHHMQGFGGRPLGIPGMPPMSFPMMNNPMLAAMTGGMALNPLLMNHNSAALALASASVASGHTSPAAALASLAAAHGMSTASSTASCGSNGPIAKSPRISNSATSSPFKREETSPVVSNGTNPSNESPSSPAATETPIVFRIPSPPENGTATSGSPKEETRSESSTPPSKAVKMEEEQPVVLNGNGHLAQSTATA